MLVVSNLGSSKLYKKGWQVSGLTGSTVDTPRAAAATSSDSTSRNTSTCDGRRGHTRRHIHKAANKTSSITTVECVRRDVVQVLRQVGAGVVRELTAGPWGGREGRQSVAVSFWDRVHIFKVQWCQVWQQKKVFYLILYIKRYQVWQLAWSVLRNSVYLIHQVWQQMKLYYSILYLKRFCI